MSAEFKIVESQSSIAGAAGHNLFVLLDPAGILIGELDGLATDPSGKIISVGGNLFTSDDHLFVYVFSGKNLFQSSDPQKIIAEGTIDQVFPVWNAALQAAADINAKCLSENLSNRMNHYSVSPD